MRRRAPTAAPPSASRPRVLPAAAFIALSRACGWIVVAVGATVLCGWALRVDRITRLAPTWVSMKPNTALCLAALGAALLLAEPGMPLPAEGDGRAALRRAFRLGLSALVGIAGILSLVEIAAGIDLGIDGLLFSEEPGAPRTDVPGRMALPTAIELILLSLASCLRGAGGRRSSPSRWICLGTAAIALVEALGYAYGVQPSSGLGSGTSMAFHTALCLILLSLGLATLDPERGAVRYFRSAEGAGSVARRLLPAAFLVPTAIAGLKLAGDRLGLYEPSFGALLVAATYMILLVVLALGTARVLERADRERLRAEEDVRRRDRLLSLTGEMARIGGWEFDVATWKGSWTEEVAKMHGVDPAFQPTLGFVLGRLEGDSRPIADRAFSRAAAEAMPFDLELGLLPLGGGSRRVRVVGIPVIERGAVTAIRGSIQDITERRSAEEAKAEIEERYRALVEQATESLLVHDLEGRIVEVNRRACEVLGYTREELLGMGVFDIEVEIEVERAKAAWRRVAEGTFVTIAGRQRRKDGSEFPVEVRLGRLEWRGQVLLLGLCRDVTERVEAERALRESEERYRGLFENMIEGFCYCRMEYEGGAPSDYTYLAVNPAFSRLVGIEGVVGKRASEVVPGIRLTDPQFFEAYARIARTRKPDRFELEVKALGLWLEVSVYFPREGHFVAVFDVITERKRAEEAILALNADLEERVRRRTAELEDANAELEAFSYSVSHDLRSPLRGIDGWSAAVEEEFGESLPSKARDYLARVRSEASRMGSLIDSLLQLARVGRAEMEREGLDLSAISESVAARARLAYPDRAIDFEIEPGLRALGDRKLVEIALANLFDNACKFTGRRERAKVEFGLAPEGTAPPGRKAFFVRDNGAGFDMSYASKLFSPFQRMHKASEFPGTGIGLATVHRIVAKHGGRVWADARPGEGAAFYFTLGDADGH